MCWAASTQTIFVPILSTLTREQSLGLSLAPAIIWGPLGGRSEQIHMSATVNLAQARREAREFGEERRREIKKRVREYREKCARMSEKHSRRQDGDR